MRKGVKAIVLVGSRVPRDREDTGDGGHAGRVTLPAGGGRGATALPNEGSPQPHSIIRLFDDSIISRIVVFGEWNKLGAEAVAAEKIEFRQTPYDIVTRR